MGVLTQQLVAKTPEYSPHCDASLESFGILPRVYWPMFRVSEDTFPRFSLNVRILLANLFRCSRRPFCTGFAWLCMSEEAVYGVTSPALQGSPTVSVRWLRAFTSNCVIKGQCPSAQHFSEGKLGEAFRRCEAQALGSPRQDATSRCRATIPRLRPRRIRLQA
jgi:hypothetical protein